ncbi:MAG: hypothetical protein IIC97_10510 [Chloroflexi bacterium]|nr:hypothetical protein [Chloroflexota bacterium]
MPRDDRATTAEKAELYDVTMPLLKAMYSEFKELSKRRPNDAVSVAKIKVVNRLLVKCHGIILEDEASVEYLDLLDEDNVPLNSDVVLMLSQFVVAMQEFNSNYYRYNALLGKHEWAIPKQRR